MLAIAAASRHRGAACETLESLARDGVQTDSGGDITVAPDDRDDLQAISVACAGD